jgi:hypothetical protein
LAAKAAKLAAWISKRSPVKPPIIENGLARRRAKLAAWTSDPAHRPHYENPAFAPGFFVAHH